MKKQLLFDDNKLFGHDNVVRKSGTLPGQAKQSEM